MSWFTDLLEGIPTNSLLREQKSALEAKNKDLEAKLVVSEARVREVEAQLVVSQQEQVRLNEELKRFSHIELDEPKTQILVALARDGDQPLDMLQETLGFHPESLLSKTIYSILNHPFSGLLSTNTKLPVIAITHSHSTARRDRALCRTSPAPRLLPPICLHIRSR